MLPQFSRLNGAVEAAGSVTQVTNAREMFRYIARCNDVQADVLGRLRVLDTSKVTWDDGMYQALWDVVRHEHEIEPRYKRLDAKLSLIRKNTQLFSDMLAAHKSNTLEVVIIGLLAAELGIWSYDLFLH